MVPRRLLAPLAAVAVLCAAPATALAAAPFEHVSATAVEAPGNEDDVVAPGERIQLDHRVRNSGTTTLSGLRGTLVSSTQPPLIFDETRPSPYDDLAPGATVGNASPYRLRISDVTCGTILGFTVGFDQGGTDAGLVSFKVPTGTAAAARVVDGAADLPAALTDATVGETGIVPGVTEVGLDVGGSSSRIKDLKIRIPDLVHPRVGDLKLEAISPGGAEIVLLDRRGGEGDNLTGAVFTMTGGASLDGAQAPFTGTYQPEGDLTVLGGKQLVGPWRLRITDTAPGATGTLNAWGITASRAVCDGIPSARLTATPEAIAPGGSVTFDASDSTDDFGIVRYDWDLDGNGVYSDAVDRLNAGPRITASFPTRGRFPVTVRVTDADGFQSTETFRLPVTLAPQASFTSAPTDPTPLTGAEVTLDGSASSDPDIGGSITRYQWNLDGDSGGTFEVDGDTKPVHKHRFARPGRHVVGLRVTDSDGATHATTRTVVVGNRPPTAVISAPATAAQGVSQRLSAVGSTDPDGTLVRYEWDFDGNGTFERTTPGALVDHAFVASGSRTVTVRVVDSSGASATAGTTVRVHAPPVIAVTATPTSPRTGELVTFDASGTIDPDGGTAMTFRWDIDDDGIFELETGTARTASRAFPNAGWVTIRVQATDADGGVAVRAHQVYVTTPPPPPETAPGSGGTTDPGSGSGSGSDPGTGTGTDTGSGSGGTPTPDTPPVTQPPSSGGEAPTPPAVSDPLPAPDSAPPPPTGGSGDLPGVAPAAYTARLGGAPIQRLKAVRRKGVRLSCVSPSAGRCVIAAFLRKGRRTIRLGGASARLDSGRPTAVYLKLGKKAQRRLPRRGSARIVLRGFARDAAGRRVELSRTVLVRR